MRRADRSRSCEVARHEVIDGAAHRARGLVRPLLPGEDAGREDAVEADLPEPGEQRLEILSIEFK